MKEIAFWGFFIFGSITALLAFAGGGWTLAKGGGAGANALGFLVLFLGASLAFMLGCLLFIRTKERKKP